MCAHVNLTISPKLTKILENTPTDVRLIKIEFEKEQMMLSKSLNCIKCFEDDWDTMIIPECEENVPCLILYRLDSSKEGSYDYVFLSWIPDSTRNKMILSIAQGNLLRVFGRDRVTKIISSASSLEDVSFSSYQSSLNFKVEDAMTLDERVSMELKQQERAEPKLSRSTMKGVFLPFDSQASSELEKVLEGNGNLLCLNVNPKTEEISFICRQNISINNLCELKIACGFFLYRYDHVHENENKVSYVFIYVIPGYGASIKERTMYASSKAGILNYFDSLDLGKLYTTELDSISYFTEEYLMNLLYPRKLSPFKYHEKPSGPKNRGPRRL